MAHHEYDDFKRDAEHHKLSQQSYDNLRNISPLSQSTMKEVSKEFDIIDHPPHYGGEDNPYEAIKVIEAWRLGFCLGNVLKYISRYVKKNYTVEQEINDLKKARWYLDREISNMEKTMK